MAVLKIVPKLYQEKISEKLKEEISLVTTGEAKYYNRLYKFFQYTDIQCTADINYETRKMYMDSLEKEDISEKYKAELLSLFDRLKIENMPDVYSQGKPFSVEQEFFKQDKLFLLYVPNKKKAQSFRQVVDKNDLLWDLTRIHSSQLVRQTKILLCEILNMDKVQRHRRYFLEPLKALVRFCDKYGIDDIEEMEQADENRFYLYLNKESDAVYDLVLNADGLDEDYSYQLKLKEEQPSDKQANELFTQAKNEIDDSFCEKGQSVEQVRGHINMKEAYAQGAVEAEWTLSDYDLVDIDGDVNQDAFEETDDEQGKLISASVELSCGEHRQLYDFSFVVFPDELDAGERLIKGINRHIDSEMSKTGTKKLTLPDEVDGVKLSWSQEKSNTAAKIAMLEVVVIVLLVLEKKEKKKTAQKERNIQLQLEYPEIVSKMAVLMGSGMTVEQAWNRITARYLDERKNNDKNIMPAYEEMLVTEREISDGVTGRKAYAGFAERVKLPCYQKLVRIILQSIHKGSKGVCEMLEKESEDAFDERRLLALKLGEEAGTKMLMPMMIMMAIVIAIVIAPAIIDFKI